MNVSLGSETIPGVLVVMSAAELPSGQAWTLEASYTDELGRTITYRPRGGSGTGAGAQVALVDYAAPVRTLVTYTLRSATTVTASITRTWGGGSLALVTLSGGFVVDANHMRDGGDKREPVQRFHASEVPGNPYMPLRLAPVAGKGGGALTIWTTGTATANMWSLAESNALVYMLHECGEPDCDIPMSAIVKLTSTASDRPGGMAGRIWSLSYVLASDPEPDLVMGLSTWPEFDARWAGSTWADFDAAMAAETWDDFDLTDWSSFA